MILFKSIKWRNFLSYGNEWTEIDLNKTKTTLIVGDNGSGKSTMLDALLFALYGKPFRDINKPQLVNSITGKGLVTEVQFVIGSKHYTVRRGIKPALFEVYIDDNLVNQNASADEYQLHLERNILKMNMKTFKQIVVIGSANFVPFMQLKTQTRREVIEDLLDIQIFSKMNLLLKAKVQAYKEQVQKNTTQLNLIDHKKDLIRKHIEEVKKSSLQSIEDTKQEIANTKQTIADLKQEAKVIIDLNKPPYESARKTAQSIQQRLTKLAETCTDMRNKQRRLEKEIDFYNNNQSCPTCKQDITESAKHRHVSTYQTRLDKYVAGLQDAERIEATLKEQLEQQQQIVKTHAEALDQVTKNEQQVLVLQGTLNALNNKLNEKRDDTGIVDNNKQELVKLKAEFEEATEYKRQLSEQKHVLDSMQLILRDGGIKTKIIRQYIPVINRLINKYLAALDFFVNFELDEQFSETIKSRHRDEFSYNSFSEGEKMRIDLSLLFAWRAVAKLRNSATTNLLILDEIFDSSLDVAGTDEFLKIVGQLTGDSNVFIISHKTEQLYDKFEQVLRFEKHKNFSKVIA